MKKLKILLFKVTFFSRAINLVLFEIHLYYLQYRVHVYQI